ncbi:MAG TPA: penicillin-binding protein 2 [Candidatus Aquicultor sp.]|jgi:penicillin-binding protein 2
MKLIDATFDKNVKPDDARPRLMVLMFVAFTIFAVLISRLWILQVMGGQKYMALAEGNYIRDLPIEAPRGLIFDRSGKVLVNNRPSIGITLSPPVAEKNPRIINRLAGILHISSSDIREKLAEKKADPLKPRVIARDIDDKTLAYIEEHKMGLPGVDVVTESIRSYPFGSLGAHVFGYLGEISQEEMQSKKNNGSYALGDIIGKSGAESVYEGLLRGQKGSEQIEVNASGRPLSIIKKQEPLPGSNLMLSLDLSLQQVTEQALKDAMQQARNTGTGAKANGGAAIVLDPRNGDVLAMASLPTYDPALFIGGISKKNWQQLIDKKTNFPLNNRAIMAYAPGSTFKPVTLIGALADGIIKTNDTFDCGGKWLGLGKKWARWCWDHAGHGTVGLTRGMAESCDVVFYSIGYKFYKTGGERLQYWARVFGIGSLTGIDLPMEAKGRVPDKQWKEKINDGNPEYQRWYPGDTVNIAIGQGDILATPLQMASLYAAIANGGILYRPHVGKAMISWDGNVKREFKLKPEDKRKLDISKDIIRFNQDALEKTVTQGTAAAAFSGFSTRVAGKTGTAQVRGKGDYAWFAGYAPVEEPRYVVVVMVEQGGHGGTIAAPAARKILAAAMGIPDRGAGYVNDLSR